MQASTASSGVRGERGRVREMVEGPGARTDATRRVACLTAPAKNEVSSFSRTVQGGRLGCFVLILENRLGMAEHDCSSRTPLRRRLRSLADPAGAACLVSCSSC